MCNKQPWLSLLYCLIWSANFTALTTGSGGMLYLGGLLLSNNDPANNEYPFYASSSGFSIGLNSAFMLQWITASVMTSCVALNAKYVTHEPVENRILGYSVQAIVTLIAFSGLHYLSLPMMARNQVTCLDISQIITSNDNTQSHQSPLCDPEHSWEFLYKAFFVGTGIGFAGFFFLSLCCICLHTYCCDEKQEKNETAAENNRESEQQPNDFIIDMSQIPQRASRSQQPNLSQFTTHMTTPAISDAPTIPRQPFNPTGILSV